MSFYICSNCGYGSASWLGKCPDCGQWDTLKKQNDGNSSKGGKKENLVKFVTKSLTKIKSLNKERKQTKMFEFDRVLGNGFIPGEIILLTGEPGVGKSTLLLQALSRLNVLYISGEEAAEQIKDRAQRLKINTDNFLFSDNLQIESITQGVEDLKDKPDILVIDSIQTVYSVNSDSPPGTINQLKDSAMKLAQLAKKIYLPIIIIGHVTKEGEVAGPKTLEHLVDCVLSFEGEQASNFRVLRASKNRFGSTNEIGIFEMKQEGLIESNDPLLFVAGHDENVPGRAIIEVSEGKRILFYEIQTLAVPTMLSVPRRVVKGVDYNKVLLLLAVIRKHLHLPLDKYDIYVNVVGGVNVKSTAADLGIIASMISSIKNTPLPKKTAFSGEVGLLGEVRKNYFEERMIKEAKRLKFQNIFSYSRINDVKQLASLFS